MELHLSHLISYLAWKGVSLTYSPLCPLLLITPTGSPRLFFGWTTMRLDNPLQKSLPGMPPAFPTLSPYAHDRTPTLRKLGIKRCVIVKPPGNIEVSGCLL
jgi:hypothetical protein